MRIPSYTKQFAKDLKRMEKRGKSPEKIKKVIKKLVNEERLDANCKDHKLVRFAHNWNNGMLEYWNIGFKSRLVGIGLFSFTS